jgi:hypothetical protein
VIMPVPAALPDMTGLSSRNLKYMRKFAESWQDHQLCKRCLHKLPSITIWPCWKKQMILISGCGTPKKHWNTAGAAISWPSRSKPASMSSKARPSAILKPFYRQRIQTWRPRFLKTPIFLISSARQTRAARLN